LEHRCTLHRHNDISAIENDRARIDSELATFRFNSRLQSQQSSGQIDNLQQQLALDDEIITLRENIREKATKKVQMGTETVNEMLRDVNAVGEARQARDVHEIELLKEIFSLNHINGEK